MAHSTASTHYPKHWTQNPGSHLFAKVTCGIFVCICEEMQNIMLDVVVFKMIHEMSSIPLLSQQSTWHHVSSKKYKSDKCQEKLTDDNMDSEESFNLQWTRWQQK